jgi:hypothetical protein
MSTYLQVRVLPGRQIQAIFVLKNLLNDGDSGGHRVTRK